MTIKTCFKCGETKALALFHKHKGMKDGHLNKCAACVTAYVTQWNKKQAPGHHQKVYARCLVLGSHTRVRSLEEIRASHDPEARRRTSLKYHHKRAAKVRGKLDEFTDFAFTEAIQLCRAREQLVGGKWTLDHIIPLHHKNASGLHVGANFQVVPDRWNFRKSNKNMLRYFGEPLQTETTNRPCGGFAF